MNIENTPVIARADGSFVVQHNGAPYHVVSKDLDPFNVFDIDEVRAFAKAHPKEVSSETLPSPKEAEVAAMKAELADLDAVIPRSTEDIYAATGTKPHPKVKSAIDRKNALRASIKKLES